MRALFFATACLLPLPLMAQNTPPRAPRPVAIPGQQAPRDEAALAGNIMIRLQGTMTTGSEIDLSLAGIGPRFTADQVVGDDTVLSCQYVVSETETGYKVSYVVSTRIKIATQSGPNSTSFEYRDVSISGTVLCLADRPVVLVRNGPKPLQLTITKEAEHVVPPKGP